VRTTPTPVDMAPRNPVRTWTWTRRAAGYIAGSALLAGTVLFLLDPASPFGSGPLYRRTGAGPLVDQAKKPPAPRRRMPLQYLASWLRLPTTWPSGYCPTST
jgi:hypothetical protein